MYQLLRVILISFVFGLLLFNISVFSQTSETPPDGPVDQSNVIFPACRLSVLSTGSKGEITKEKKGEFIRGCIQDIIRFVIVISCLGAILKIAASGLSSMDPTNTSKAEPPLKVVSNLVIGLFLLLVGWNLVGILNSSFNNANFLNLPGLDNCKIANGCETEAQKTDRRSQASILKYQTILDSYKIQLDPTELKTVTEDVKLFCQDQTNKRYNSYRDKIDTSICNKGVDSVVKIAEENKPEKFIPNFSKFVNAKNALALLRGKDMKFDTEDVRMRMEDLKIVCAQFDFASNPNPNSQETAKECNEKILVKSITGKDKDSNTKRYEAEKKYYEITLNP
jgi:hypothetical protein